MTTARSERGFTLLEVIIAVTLVSLLLGGVFGCVRLSLDTLNRVDARLIRERRVASVEQILRAELEGILPVIAQCTSVGDEPSERIAFFEGEPATMRFVSTYSLNERARGLPRILELQVIPGENREGVRLIVNEHVYAGPGSAGAFCLSALPGETEKGPRFPPVETGPGSFVLADRLAYCRFVYHAPPAPGELTPQWLPRWRDPTLPDAVRVDMAPLHASASEIDLQPVTAPLRVTRNAMTPYAQ